MGSRRLIKSFMLISLTMATSAYSRSGGHITTDSFGEVSKTISAAVSTYGADRVLVALDIDNTTLETETDFGSEHWFLWQSKMIQEGNFNDGAVASNISDLLALQSNIISLAGMRPVESRIPSDLTRFGEQGVRMLALTSRGSAMHDATLRELSANKFPYDRFAPGSRPGNTGPYKPYDLRRVEDAGLTQQDVEAFGLKEATPVIYDRGVYLTEGQHKGIMLRTLLHKLKQNFDAIIFIDDRLRHSEGVQAAFAKRHEIMTTIQYTHTAANIAKFESSDKSSVKRAWCVFARSLRVTDGGRPRIPYMICTE